MSGEIDHSDGRRTVGLYMPFVSAGIGITAIVFEPCTFGHLLRWQAGQIMGAMALMTDLTGQDMHVLESIRHPDDQRVMKAFLEHIHPQIAEDIRAGQVPVGSAFSDRPPAPAEPFTEMEPEAPERPGLDDWGGGASGDLAQDPLTAHPGFEPVTSDRPKDYVPGLDD